MKTIDRILTGLQYITAAGLVVAGIVKDQSSAITLGLSLLILTGLYHMEKRRRKQLQEILKQLPDDKIVARQAAKNASEFTKLNTFEQGVYEHGFIAGVKFIYKRLNAK